ncbi:TetR family transcriptional regulator [Actinoplanes bogorensis]|uniref:TetR family transcriptional regulator n=1 Tax=Paractinoplanes bogorensis TaxID=1610840 RepID=A0ABS5YNV0_9ACTN|nr:TetR family transcriptional regulator [Actinoplanes bogorensis]MBU2663675.1 TetR family transcriptional regulator [Actinoplanes bogorensis]
MDFKRANTDEQRAERRQQILRTAATMLTEMPVARLSLNELSRRVGLAKSNVLRYFESREAVLLDLLDAELWEWLGDLDRTLQPGDGSARDRGDRLAAALADSLVRRPVLCDLTSAHAGVLEHNVSAEVALQHKRATARAIAEQSRLMRRCLPELGPHDATSLVALTTLLTSASWPYSQPPEALLTAYATDPAVAAMRVDFTALLTQALAVTISGLLARQEDRPFGAAL